MSLSSQAQIEQQQKIHAAKLQFEENGGKTIKADKVMEWALLEIAEMLQAIHYQLVQSSIPKFTGTRQNPPGFVDPTTPR